MMRRSSAFLVILLIGAIACTECDLQEEACFPYEENQFSELLSKFSEELKLSSINNYAKKNENFIQNVEFRLAPNKGIGLFTNEKIFKNDKIIRIKTNRIFSSLDYRRMYELNKGTPFITFVNKDMPKIPGFEPRHYRFILLLHHHLANLEGSEYFEELVGLPVNITNPKIVLPIDLIDSLEYWMREHVRNFRTRMKKAYKAYANIIKKAWSAEVQSKILGEFRVTFANFAYCFFVLHSRGRPVFSKEGTESALIPTYQYINTPSLFKWQYPSDSLLAENPNSFVITAMKDFEPNEEVTQMYGTYTNSLNYLIYGYFPTENDHHCENIDDEDLTYRLKEIISVGNCIEKRNILKLFNRINLRNLNKTEKAKCESLMKHVQIENPERDIFEKCPKAVFEIWNKVWHDLKAFHSKKSRAWQMALNSWTEAKSIAESFENSLINKLYEDVKLLYEKNADFAKGFVREMDKLELVSLSQNQKPKQPHDHEDL